MIRMLILVSVSVGAFLASISEARVIRVPEDYSKIQTAIDSASYGDTVSVGAGTYSPSTNNDSFPIIMKNGVKLLGDTADPINTIIDAEWTNTVIRCVLADSTTKINGFTITHGKSQCGGGIYCENADLTISNNRITENKSEGEPSRGAGIYSLSSSPVVIENEITGNLAYSSASRAHADGGGIYWESSSPFRPGEITHNMIAGNTVQASGFFSSDAYGAGIYISSSTPRIVENVISGNNASGGGRGGGIYCGAASGPTIDRNKILSNTASHEGGGICCFSTASFEIINDTVSGNSSVTGGGIRCNNASPAICGNVISSNTASGAGGGLNCYKFFSEIDGNTITDNSANTGGGIYCEQSPSAQLMNNTISANHASEGGGLYLVSSISMIKDNEIFGDTAILKGGGIYTDRSEPWIVNNRIMNNEAFDGGALYCAGSPLPTLGGRDCTYLNSILDNGFYYVYNASQDTLAAEHNCWGTLDSLGVAAHVYGPVDYVPWCSTRVEEEIVAVKNLNSARLDQNWPNPFRGSTYIRYQIDTSCRVSLKIYNLAGELVCTLVNRKTEPGIHTLRWDRRNEAGEQLPPGVYFYVLESGALTATRKMVILE